MINISVKLNKNEHYGRENIDSALKRLKNKMDQANSCSKNEKNAQDFEAKSSLK